MTIETRNNWLCDYRKSITSQNGEDGVLEKIFLLIGTENKWCVEFGAGSGKKGNNTWHLINNDNWKGVLIEAERALFDDLQKRYSSQKGVRCLNAAVEPQGKNSLDNLLAQTDIPEIFDFLSIDIDGLDYQVWQFFCNYKPNVVMIEINPNMPIDFDFVQPTTVSAPVGSSLLSVTRLAKEKGYELVYSHKNNAIFVKKDLFHKFGIGDNSPRAIVCNPSDYNFAGSFFQMYDGSIVLVGVPAVKLLAFRKKIKETAVWVLDDNRILRVKFTKDLKVLRLIKNFFKKTKGYSMIYFWVKKFYGRKDEKTKKRINRDE